MKIADVRKIAKKIGVNSGKMNKQDLIHSVQRAEGNQDCYNRGQSATCGQQACAWREDCQ